MIDPILHILAISALIIASWVDIKTREVPDTLTYGLIFAALGFRSFQSIISQDITFIVEGLAGFGVFFVFAMLTFYTGQWGGGDAKLLMGLGALMGISLPLALNQFLIAFIINLLFVGAVYGLFWAISLSIRNWGKFRKETKRFLRKKNVIIIRRAALITSVIFLLIAIALPQYEFKILLAFLAIFALLAFYFGTYAKIIEKCCMEKSIPVEKLTEGDWILKDVKIDGKRICGPKDLGISKENIKKLITYKKKGKIKEIEIKEGIPFVPSFLLAYLLTIFVGNIILFFI